MLGKDIQEIWDALPEQRKQKIDARYQELREEYLTLQELRKALDVTQEELAGTLNVHQVNISKLEKRSDLKLSTLKEYLAGLGFSLKLVAEAPGKPSIVLSGLGETEDSKAS